MKKGVPFYEAMRKSTHKIYENKQHKMPLRLELCLLKKNCMIK